MQVNKGLQAAQAWRQEGPHRQGAGAAGTESACGDRMRGTAGPVCPGGVEVPTKVKRLDFIQRETDNQGGFQQ